MSKKNLQKAALDELERRFGERVSEDPVERYIYSRDVGEFPPIVGKMVGGRAQVVVLAEDAEDISWIMDFARREGIPLTPRSAATSGYGGVIPIEGGIVVDLTRMNRILDVDEGGKTARVETGVIWWDLEKYLRQRGLALRTYPSSAISATVGGWVAEGGSGIGSYSYGNISDNLLSLEVATPQGVKHVEGEEIELYVGSEGLLGFITEVELAVREAEEDIPILFAFDKPPATQSFIDDLGTSELPIFHLQVITPQLAALKNQVVEEAYLPENSYLALAALSTDDSASRKAIEESAKKAGGRQLGEEASREEWEERLYPLRIKKAGPSVIPAEATIPTANLAKLFEATSKRLPELPLEVIIHRDGSAICLGFIPADARSADFTFRFTASLEFLRLAEKYGGSPYGIGLYFVDKAVDRWGDDKIRRLEEVKREADPACILNPGKILDNCIHSPRLKALRGMMAAAKISLPMAVPSRRLVPRVRTLRKKLPQEVEDAVYTCAQCGYCKDGCTLYSGRGWESSSPRGKMQYLKGYSKGEVPLTEEMSNAFLLCTTCKKCDFTCQTDLPIESVWEEMRGELVASGKFPTFPPFEMMGASYDLENNIWAGFSEERDAWLPDDVQPLESGDVAYWAGCTASYVENDIARGAVRILKEGGQDFVYLGKDETCCGVPFLMSGKWDLFEEAVRRNVKALKERGIKTIYASCPGCWVTLSQHYEEWAEKLGLDWDMEVHHITELAAEMVRDGRLTFKNEVPLKATWHDPCHISRHGGIIEEPREVLKAIPGLELEEMEHSREDGLCCGSVLTLIGETRPTSERIASQRLQEAKDTGAEAIITTCPCCEFQLRVWSANEGNGIKVLDFASVLSEALGEKLENPDPKVQDSWAVFDVMIQLMTPQGMAEFMWEFIDDLSLALGKAMRLGKRLPKPLLEGMFSITDRIMPSMMPRMLPLMMPWMLKRMMPLMEKKMPTMSDSMRELMPDILPRVMEKIMPYLMPRIMRCMFLS